jgi:hypothetical protein
MDALKASACEEAGITLIRITNEEVFGDREVLLKKLRAGLLRAVMRGKSQRARRSLADLSGKQIVGARPGRIRGVPVRPPHVTVAAPKQRLDGR